jgi:hypothetical protein
MNLRHIAPLAALLVAGGLLVGQPPAKSEPSSKDASKGKEPAKPTPGSLEDTLEKSLRSSADIKAAEAKVREAEAELNKVRHQVLTKATALHSDLTLAKRMLATAEQALARQRDAHQRGTVSVESIMAAESMVTKHRGEVEKLETELKSLRGEFAIKGAVAYSPDGAMIYLAGIDRATRIWDADATVRVAGRLDPFNSGSVDSSAAAARSAVKSPMAERVRKLLDQEVEWATEHRNAAEVVRGLLELAKSDIPFRELAGPEGQAEVVLQGKMPIGAWLQAVEDTDPKIVIVVRDYGLLLTKKDRMPTGAIGVSELWKMKETNPKDETRPAEKGK